MVGTIMRKCKDCKWYSKRVYHVNNDFTCVLRGMMYPEYIEVCECFEQKDLPKTCDDCVKQVNCKIYTGHLCKSFERKTMLDEIKINVSINGKPAKLSDISDETLANIKKSEVKPIEHGDYGYISFNGEKNYCLFIKVKNTVRAYDKDGIKLSDDVNQTQKNNLYYYHYIITGNIFKDMQNATAKN